MKNGIWRYAFFACACAGMSAWWWAQRFSGEHAPARDENAAILTLHDASAYRYGDSGERTDTLQAAAVHYYGDDRDILFTRPRLRREQADGHIAARAQSGRHLPDGSVHLEGDAVMERLVGATAELTVASQAFTYHPAANTLATEHSVTFTTPQSITTSTGAIWQLEHNSLILGQNVRSRYEPSPRR